MNIKDEELRNFIEKIAVWYELRYPDYEINKLMNCHSKENNNINDVMFKNNSYINNLFDENFDVKDLEWSEFYNASTFINSLPLDERCLLSEPWYSSVSYLIPNEKAPFNLYLTKDGFVENSKNVSKWTNSVIKDDELIGLHAKEVVELFKNRGITLPKNNVLEEIIANVDKQIYFRKELLNCIMYRIIERGENKIGIHRALLFAEEFDINYVSSFYISKEKELYQRFVNAVTSHINHEEVKKLKLKRF